MKKSQNMSNAVHAFIVGRSAFKVISAVEGIDLNGSVQEELEEFDRRGLSPRARRDAVKAMFEKQSS